MPKIELEEALETMLTRIATLEQQRLELQQAIEHLSAFTLNSMIELNLLDRKAVANYLEATAKAAGKRCQELGGDGRPNPCLAELAELMRLEACKLELIQGGKQDEEPA